VGAGEGVTAGEGLAAGEEDRAAFDFGAAFCAATGAAVKQINKSIPAVRELIEAPFSTDAGKRIPNRI